MSWASTHITDFHKSHSCMHLHKLSRSTSGFLECHTSHVTYLPCLISCCGSTGLAHSEDVYKSVCLYVSCHEVPAVTCFAVLKVAYAGPAAEPAAQPEPFAREAKFLSESKVLGRDVRVMLEGVDKFGNLFGQVYTLLLHYTHADELVLESFNAVLLIF